VLTTTPARSARFLSRASLEGCQRRPRHDARS
jgi:hypothetical protein